MGDLVVDLKKAIESLNKSKDPYRRSAAMLREIIDVYDQYIHKYIGEDVYLGSLDKIADYAKFIIENYGNTPESRTYLNDVAKELTHFNNDNERFEGIENFKQEFQTKFNPPKKLKHKNERFLSELYRGSADSPLALNVKENGFLEAIKLRDDIKKEIMNEITKGQNMELKKGYSLNGLIKKMKSSSSLPLHRTEKYTFLQIEDEKSSIEAQIKNYIQTFESESAKKKDKLTSADIPAITGLLNGFEFILVNPKQPLKHGNYKTRSFASQ